MNIEQSLFQFIDFYLLPNLSQKSIDLLKIKLDRNSKKITDPLLREVTLIRDALSLISERRKPLAQIMVPENSGEKLYIEVLRLKPHDCLILTSSELFSIPINHLSLALKTSTESIEFRRTQLLTQFQEDGFSLEQLKGVSFPWSRRRGDAPTVRTYEQVGFLQNFQKLPLALRFTIETSLILMGLLGLLWLIPEIRNRYENSIQKRINDYLIESSLVDSPAPAGTSKTAKPLAPDAVSTGGEEEEETLGLNRSSSDELSSRKQPKVNAGETWRFSFTGAATNEIESGVMDSLQKLSISSDKPLTVPGGIQFNFVVPVERVIPLKNALEQLVNDIQQKTSVKGSGMNLASFSWYKKRNMGTRKIPSGQVQIIVWISTL